MLTFTEISSSDHDQFHVFLAIEIAKLFQERTKSYLGRGDTLEEDLAFAKDLAEEVTARFGVDQVPLNTIKVLEEM